MDNTTAWLAAFCIAAAAWCAAVVWCAARGRRNVKAMNPHAHLLGQVVEAKVYEASDWERMVVVAVSWEGAVCVRRLSDQRATGRWIPKDKAPHRVREVAS